MPERAARGCTSDRRRRLVLLRRNAARARRSRCNRRAPVGCGRGAASGDPRAAHWHEVGAVIRAADWDDAGWEREEEERQRLWQAASERIDEVALLCQLTAATDALAGALHDAAVIAAAREGGADTGLVRAAAEAALMAVHQSELAGLAGEGAGHFFVLRRALFERGRWPLGTYRGQYLVF